jgi:hypothetical protein
MKQDTYNGWTNYETWNAALWLSNDESSQDLCNELAQHAYDRAEDKAPFSRTENAAFALADQIRGIFDEQASESPTLGWMADAVNTYLSEVNWHEIAKGYMENVELEQEA